MGQTKRIVTVIDGVQIGGRALLPLKFFGLHTPVLLQPKRVAYRPFPTMELYPRLFSM